MTHHADYSKHTDDELREGIAKAREQSARVEAEDSEEARRAQQEQLEAMEQELRRRAG